MTDDGSDRSGNGTSMLSLLVKHHTSKPLISDSCLGDIEISLGELLQICENNQGILFSLFIYLIFISAVDAVLELRSTKGSDSTIIGLISVRLSTSDPAQAGAMAISNAQQDIKRGDIAKFTGLADSEPARVVGAAVDIVAHPGNIVTSLESVVSKLGVFVRIVDQAAKVSRWTRYE